MARDVEKMGDQVKHARASFIELGTQALRLANHVYEARLHDVDSLLGRVGLQRRSSPMRAVAWFAAGAVIAGGAVMLLTPLRGEELVGRMASTLRRTGEKIESTVGGRAHHNGEANAVHDIPDAV
jgi:hypothetical protein